MEYNLEHFDPALIKYIIENRLEKIPDDLENDCWLVPAFAGAENNAQKRSKGSYMGKNLALYHVTYLAWWGIPVDESPFNDCFVASHTCEETSPDSYRCVNPLHIHGESQADNVRRYSRSEKGVVWKEKLSAKSISSWENGRLPSGLSNYEKAEWYLKNRTKERTDLPKTNGSSCLEWTMQICSEGYPRVKVSTSEHGDKFIGKLMAHRFIYCMLNELWYGTEENPWKICKKEGTVAHHECNFKACVNPAHISLVSRSENTQEWAKTRKTG